MYVCNRSALKAAPVQPHVLHVPPLAVQPGKIGAGYVSIVKACVIFLLLNFSCIPKYISSHQNSVLKFIALKRSGHDFSFTNRSSGRCCDFAPPWSQRTGGTTISSVPICPVITENGNTVTVKIQAFLGYTPSRFSHGFGGSFLSTKAGPTPATCVPAVFRDILSFLSNPVKNRVR